MIQPAKLLRTALVTAVFSTVCVVSASAASVSVGTVNTDALRFRDEVSTSAIVLGTASKGGTMVVLEDAGNGWYKVGYKSMEGYMSGEYLGVSTKADVIIGYGLVRPQGSSLNVCSGPGTSYDKVTSLNNGVMANIAGIDNGWYKTSINGITGYVSNDYMVTCRDSAGSRGDGVTAVTIASNSSLDQQVVNYAKQYPGCPYVHGGNGPSSLDCSGYTSYVYHHFGYTLNRIASTQLFNGISASKSELQPGDLVFFKYNTSKAASHVGIYIGGGQFTHALTNIYTVKTDDLTRGHCANAYAGVRRILRFCLIGEFGLS